MNPVRDGWIIVLFSLGNHLDLNLPGGKVGADETVPVFFLPAFQQWAEQTIGEFPVLRCEMSVLYGGQGCQYLGKTLYGRKKLSVADEGEEIVETC